MEKWEMKRADSETEANQLLEAGWEPFSSDFDFGTLLNKPAVTIKYMWFKRRIIS